MFGVIIDYRHLYSIIYGVIKVLFIASWFTQYLPIFNFSVDFDFGQVNN